MRTAKYKTSSIIVPLEKGLKTRGSNKCFKAIDKSISKENTLQENWI
jgi:hypothetical protein